MVKAAENNELKIISEELRDQYILLDKALLLSFKGFVSHKSSYLSEALHIINDSRRNLSTVTKKLLEAATSLDKKEDIIFTIPGHTDRVLTNINIIIEATTKKISDSVLFSEKAVNELRSLYASIRGLIRDLSDLIITNNPNLAKFITDQSIEIMAEADQFATEHEERLVRGLCSLTSCSIYLDILESLKNLAWHVKQASERVSKQDYSDL